jgi:hypothetical protein
MKFWCGVGPPRKTRQPASPRSVNDFSKYILPRLVPPPWTRKVLFSSFHFFEWFIRHDWSTYHKTKYETKFKLDSLNEPQPIEAVDLIECGLIYSSSSLGYNENGQTECVFHCCIRDRNTKYFLANFDKLVNRCSCSSQNNTKNNKKRKRQRTSELIVDRLKKWVNQYITYYLHICRTKTSIDNYWRSFIGPRKNSLSARTRESYISGGGAKLFASQVV